MMASGLLSLILLLGGSSSGDLLDYAPTEDYWKAQGEQEVSIDAMASVLIKKDASDSDRLMAIRTLGELGKAQGADKDAVLKVLKPLVESKEPFVGSYARRSIAWVKGEDPDPPVVLTQEQLDADLAMLLPSSNIVGSLRIDHADEPPGIDTLLGDVPNVPGGPQPNQIRQEMLGMIMQAAGMIGNARVDSVSIGATLENENFYAVVVARGRYDRDAAKAALTKEVANKRDWNVYTADDIHVFAKMGEWEQAAMLMPSDEHFVLLIAGAGRQEMVLPVQQVLKQLNKKPAKAEFDKVVSAQMAEIDRKKADGWLALRVSPYMQQEMFEVFGPFESGRLTAKHNDKGTMDLGWQLDGSDAGAVAKAVAFMEQGVADGLAETNQQLAQEPAMKPMAEPMIKMMRSIKLKADGESMTGSLNLPTGMGQSTMFLMMMFM